MKAREFGHLLGFRSKSKSYGFRVCVFNPVKDGRVEYAQRLHPDSGFCNGGRHEGISRWKHAHAFKLRVAGRNLESYLKNHCPQLLPRLSFIKVDAEGYESQILKTLSSVIAEHRPFIKAEVYKHTNPGQREELYGFFAEHRYVIHRMENDCSFRGQVLGDLN